MPDDQKNVEVVMVAPTEITPHPQNSRVHTDAQVDAVVASIAEWGFTVPILVDGDSNTIIAGHCRQRAAIRAGLEEVPVIYTNGWTQEQTRAYIIADNRLAEMGTWDTDLLREEIELLSEADFELGLLGFEEIQIDAYLNGGGDDLFPLSDAPGAPETPVTKQADAAPTKTSDGYAALQIVMPVADRNEVNRKIRKYMEANGITSMATALIAMLGDYDG